MDENEIIRKHLALDGIIEKALADGDFRANNRAAKELMALFRTVSANRALAERVYCCLLKESCPRTQAHAASECLRMGIYIQEAEQILEKLARREDIGITALGAEYTLKVWRGEISGKSL